MGFLNQVIGGLKDRLASSGKSSGLMESIIGLINNPETGGLQGLVQKFKDNDLGSVVNSWIGKGENQSVSGEQIQQVIGDERIQKIAEKVGISKEKIPDMLAGLLPKVIDKLTPDGNLPEGNIMGQALNMLKQRFPRSEKTH
jgi:uncharacterized protein YidB (DUF937 family)